jgi:structural maintenance of chromosome 1
MIAHRLIFFQNLREEVAMEVDEDEDGTQRPRKVQDFGIEVNFDSLDDDEREVNDTELDAVLSTDVHSKDGSPEAAAEFDASIAKLSAEIEQMTPNMKAMER